MIHGHGNEIHNSSIKADFSSNIWYKGASKEVLTVLSYCIANIVNYPEPNAYELRSKAVKKKSTPSMISTILLTK